MTDEEKQKLETAVALLQSTHATVTEDRASLDAIVANPGDFTGDIQARIFDHYDKTITYLDAKASLALYSIALLSPDISALRKRVDELEARMAALEPPR